MLEYGTLSSSEGFVQSEVAGNERSLAPSTTDQHDSVAQQSDAVNEADSEGGSDATWITSTEARRQLLQEERVKRKLGIIQAAMTGNLKNSKWLNSFEPLSMACPLLGRRVPADAVSEWAAAAWDCDGLGFSWKCLQSIQGIA